MKRITTCFVGSKNRKSVKDATKAKALYEQGQALLQQLPADYARKLNNLQDPEKQRKQQEWRLKTETVVFSSLIDCHCRYCDGTSEPWRDKHHATEEPEEGKVKDHIHTVYVQYMGAYTHFRSNRHLPMCPRYSADDELFLDPEKEEAREPWDERHVLDLRRDNDIKTFCQLQSTPSRQFSYITVYPCQMGFCAQSPFPRFYTYSDKKPFSSVDAFMDHIKTETDLPVPRPPPLSLREDQLLRSVNEGSLHGFICIRYVLPVNAGIHLRTSGS